MERISLCMIVKDEEPFLGSCLDSASALVSEIIVVDTGSSDRTVEIARAAGATVLFHEWNDDFSTPRNIALEAATGTHILSLDADEVLAPSAHAALRAIAQNPAIAVALLPLLSATALEDDPEDLVRASRDTNPVLVPRFFRNHPKLRFRGRIHELIFDDYNVLKSETGMGACRVPDAPIVHYGGISSVREARGKYELYTRLMRSALEDSPDNRYLAGQLAHEYHVVGRVEEAEALCVEHLGGLLAEIERINRYESHRTDRPSPARLASVLTIIRLEQQRWAEVLEVIETVRGAVQIQHPNLIYSEALALERLGHYEKAEACYRACLELAGESFNEPIYAGACGDGALTRLAHVLLALGRPAEALGLASQSAPDNGSTYIARTLAIADAQIGLGQPAKALETLLPLARKKVPRPEVFALIYSALTSLGRSDERMRVHARALPIDYWREVRLAQIVYSPAELSEPDWALPALPQAATIPQEPLGAVFGGR